MGSVTGLPTGFLIADSTSPVYGSFIGVYPFHSSADAGANKLDNVDENLLKGIGVGPSWLSGLADQLLIKPS